MHTRGRPFSSGIYLQTAIPALQSSDYAKNMVYTVVFFLLELFFFSEKKNFFSTDLFMLKLDEIFLKEL